MEARRPACPAIHVAINTVNAGDRDAKLGKADVCWGGSNSLTRRKRKSISKEELGDIQGELFKRAIKTVLGIRPGVQKGGSNKEGLFRNYGERGWDARRLD